jgi:hypothetical protein
VARELADALTLQRHLTEIYDEVSRGRVSKPFTLPSVVTSMFHEALMEAADEAVSERDYESGPPVRQPVAGPPPATSVPGRPAAAWRRCHAANRLRLPESAWPRVRPRIFRPPAR